MDSLYSVFSFIGEAIAKWRKMVKIVITIYNIYYI